MNVCTFPARVEKAEIVLPEPEAVGELEAIALSEGEVPAFQQHGKSLGITALHDYVFLLASVGGNTREVAEVLHYPEEGIGKARDDINEFLEVPTMAASVYRGIGDDFISIRLKAGWRSPNWKEEKILNGIASGLSNGEIINGLARTKQTKRAASFDMRRLWAKMGAEGRTHSMRRSYELGIKLTATLPASARRNPPVKPEPHPPSE